MSVLDTPIQQAQTPSIDVSLHVVILFMLITHYISKPCDGDLRDKAANMNRRVLLAFTTLVRIINGCMIMYMGIIAADNRINDMSWTLKARATCISVNKLVVDFIGAAISDPSYRMYELLVLLLFCVHDHNFCRVVLKPTLYVPCYYMYTYLEPKSWIFIDQFYCLSYGADGKPITNKVGNRVGILHWFIQRTILMVWVCWTNLWLFTNEMASQDLLGAAIILTCPIVHHTPVYFGLWNPVTLVFAVFECTGEITLRGGGICGMLCFILMTSFDLQAHERYSPGAQNQELGMWTYWFPLAGLLGSQAVSFWFK